MNADMNVTLPRYQKIALDLARQIAKGEYSDGEKISSRTLVASRYNVSPETARRAIAVLADLEIVKADKGSGVTILSSQKAQEFTKRYVQAHSVGQLRQEVLSIVKKQQQEAKVLEEKMLHLMEKTRYFQGENPLNPVEITINSSTPYIDRMISEINFWQHTGATVVAIQREGELLLSPGPYAKLTDEDILYFVGDQEVHERVRLFLYETID